MEQKFLSNCYGNIICTRHTHFFNYWALLTYIVKIAIFNHGGTSQEAFKSFPENVPKHNDVLIMYNTLCHRSCKTSLRCISYRLTRHFKIRSKAVKPIIQPDIQERIKYGCRTFARVGAEKFLSQIDERPSLWSMLGYVCLGINTITYLPWHGRHLLLIILLFAFGSLLCLKLFLAFVHIEILFNILLYISGKHLSV